MTDAHLANTPPPMRFKAPTTGVRTVNNVRGGKATDKGDGARRAGMGFPARHISPDVAAGANAAWQYLGDRKVVADGERIPVIGETGYAQGQKLIERAARGKDEGGDLKPEAGDVSHEGVHRLPEAMENRRTDFWSMHKQLLVCVAIAIGICLLVAMLGRNGLLALAITLTLCVAISYFAHRRGDGKSNFNWEDVDP